jgi:DMSO reductase anchor subunit
MNGTLVKYANGLLMLCIHFGAIYFVFQRVSTRLRPEDQLAVVMILAPLTAAFVSMFLKDAVRHARQSAVEDDSFNVSFGVITILVTVLYGATIFFILQNYLTNVDVGPDMLKLYVGVIETVIGGFVGILYGELFK